MTGSAAPAPSPRRARADLRSLGQPALEGVLAGLGQPPWQAAEVRRFLLAKGVGSIAGLTSLPRPVRAALAERFTIAHPEIADRREAGDGTVKLLLRYPDGAACETVLMPQAARLTQCLSSQSGCALGCRFCRTGTAGAGRDLAGFEIVDQWLAARGILPRGRRVTNLVFMGMGEPLLNREALAEAVRFFCDPAGGGMPASRITVSTAGVVPGIEWLGAELPRVKLAVSLNAPDDALRSRLMPANRRWPLSRLMPALRAYAAGRRRVTIEYVLLGGVNDSPAAAGRLARLLRGLRCKVNLIPFNSLPGLPFEGPGPGAVLDFQATLRAAGLRALIRRSQGAEIQAACGQLGAGRGAALAAPG